MINFIVKYDPETMLITELIEDQEIDIYNDVFAYDHQYLQYENVPHIYLTGGGHPTESGFAEDTDYSYLKVGDVLTPQLIESDDKIRRIDYSIEPRKARFQHNSIAMAHFGATRSMKGSFKEFYTDSYFFNEIEEDTLQDAVDNGLITDADKNFIINYQFKRAKGNVLL